MDLTSVLVNHWTLVKMEKCYHAEANAIKFLNNVKAYTFMHFQLHQNLPCATATTDIPSFCSLSLAWKHLMGIKLHGVRSDSHKYRLSVQCDPHI